MSGAPGDEASRKQKKKQREKEKKAQQRAQQDASGIGNSGGGGAAVATAVGSPGGAAAAPSPPPPAASLHPPAPPLKDGSAAAAAAASEQVAAIDSKVIEYVDYDDERQLPEIMEMVDKDLSEPYSVFTYRYFLSNWPGLCIRAVCEGKLVGVVICKAEHEVSDHPHRDDNITAYRGYIAMLAVSRTMRRRGLGTALVLHAVRRMAVLGCDEAYLETEVTNKDSLKLYGKLGFVREERLVKYYLNGVDAFRLKLWFDPKTRQQFSKADASAEAAAAEQGEEVLVVGGNKALASPPPSAI